MFNFDNSYSRLPPTLFSRTAPVPVGAPRMVVFNASLAQELGLDSAALQSGEGAAVFSGNQLPEGALPLAQAYAGHQFGHFTMLGDGRAVLLGEQLTPTGARFDIQLKGAGRTAFSRGGDGRAALGPMLREYLISEAMHALGIPTTRSLAVVTTGETVLREQPLPGAILTRIAASHLRVGTFEYAVRLGNRDILKALADYALARHYPEQAQAEHPYRALLEGVIDRQAALVAQWMLVGFVHGVMNTDNMTLSGETIDYGPCAFMDRYHPDTLFSSIDRLGRYAYGNQPGIAQWNVARFGESLLPLLAEDMPKAIAVVEEGIAAFAGRFQYYWDRGMRAKLGLQTEEADDALLIRDLLQWMQQHAVDYTSFFRSLSEEADGAGLYPQPEWHSWHARWKARLTQQPPTFADMQQQMRRHNPSVIPRNQRVEEALSAVGEGDFAPFQRLLELLQNPYQPCADPYYLEPADLRAPAYKTFCGT